jgi:tellurite resistance protein TerC
MFWMYVGFLALILSLLVLDLGVFHRKVHEVKPKEALGWSAFWISLGLAFVGFIYLGYQNHWGGLGLTPDAMSTPRQVEGVGLVYNDGGSAALKYLTGFVVEKSLAVDNIFVIAMIFGFFAVPAIYQHRVLFWGIAGALLMRGAMIALGSALLREFAWIIYVFGAFLVVTGVKMLVAKEGSVDPSENAVLRLLRRIIPITERFHGQRFFVRAGTTASHEAPVPGAAEEKDSVVDSSRAGALLATPLLLALVMVEITDLIFAVDSIPAIFAITTDAFLVFTSNIFAILGLRSLYFALAGMITAFKYMKVALSGVLVLVGTKMLAHTWLKKLLGESFNLYMLAGVLLLLAAGVIASLVSSRRERSAAARAGESAPTRAAGEAA